MSAIPKDQLADVGEHRHQIGAEARRVRAVDHAVIIGQRKRQHQPGLEEVLSLVAFSGIDRFEGGT
jgi:hypothetical protein